MTWVKIDDQFFTHPKVLAAGKDGRALFIAALCYSAAHLTDGRIDTASLPVIAAAAQVRARPTAFRLVEVGLWEVSESGWTIHDYHDHQPAAEEVRAHREKVSKARSEAGRRGASNRWADGKPDGKAMANGMANEKQPDGKPDGKTMAPSPSPKGTPLTPRGKPDGAPPDVAGGGAPAEEERTAEALAAAVIDAMAACDLDRHQRGGTTVRQPDRWLAKARATRHEQHHAQALELARRQPTADPATIAEQLDPECGPLDGGAARARARATEDQARLDQARRDREHAAAEQRLADELIDAMTDTERHQLAQAATDRWGHDHGPIHRNAMRTIALEQHQTGDAA